MPAPTPRTETPPTPAQRWTRSLAVLVVGLALLLLLGFPWTLGALLLGPLTAIAGIVVLASRGSSELTSWARVNAIVAIVLGVFSTMSAAGMLFLMGPLNDLAECQSRAITTSAEEACQAEFDEAYQEILDGYLGGLNPAG
ncbi:hypothetical protein [Demequina zhanjiangensis]|uniref:Uncharacterized protein n=1 Tax=Demequina zhanjiangensis TaxID=3051659 RepID=A0ABT8FXH3_9MICO|nr:hypothetical protein [Demequina sp. SYSU T00b26]MDN4471600.1 hypothetical protein [Demequina sp. SYSU T00b26]